MFPYLWMCWYEQKWKSLACTSTKGRLTFSSVPSYFFSFSLSLLLHIAALLRRTSLALINVPGIHLALCLSSSLQTLPASSRILLMPSLWAQHKQASTAISNHLIMHSDTHTHTAGAWRCELFLCPALLFKSFTPADLSVMMNLQDNNNN